MNVTLSQPCESPIDNNRGRRYQAGLQLSKSAILSSLLSSLVDEAVVILEILEINTSQNQEGWCMTSRAESSDKAGLRSHKRFYPVEKRPEPIPIRTDPDSNKGL